MGYVASRTRSSRTSGWNRRSPTGITSVPKPDEEVPRRHPLSGGVAWSSVSMFSILGDVNAPSRGSRHDESKRGGVVVDDSSNAQGGGDGGYTGVTSDGAGDT